RTRKQRASVLLHGRRHVLVDDNRLARVENVDSESAIGQRFGRDLYPLAILVNVRVVEEIGRGIVNTNAHVGITEDLANLVADGVVDSLDVQLGRERRLHAVDDRELGSALIALLEQALRLVEQ